MSSERGTPPDIKPCPFCGKTPKLTSRKDVSLWNSNVVDWFTIKCTDCDIMMNECDSMEDVLKRWNTRHTP